MAGSQKKVTALSVLAVVIVGCFIQSANAKTCSGSVSEFGYASAVTNILTTLARVTPGRPTFSYDTTYAGTIGGSASCRGKKVQPCIDCLGRLQSQLSSCTSSRKGSCSEATCTMSFHKL
ncbi:unnamed protein product [Linum trigynum]|uniref:Gnk2-homologous domain-containing protein n=1 Tax=Linum trigynum TaxID=586398 RepID=A0AAV2DWW7_9ROSI